jgi:CRISPR-associated protein Cmr5
MKQLARIKELIKQSENKTNQAEWNEKYVSYVKGLPAAILMNGLGQAAATLLAASAGNYEKPHFVLYMHLQQWLCREGDSSPYPGENDLMRAITQGGREQYLRAQAEALAWLTWLKKFATAYLSKQDGGEQSDITII